MLLQFELTAHNIIRRIRRKLHVRIKEKGSIGCIDWPSVTQDALQWKLKEYDAIWTLEHFRNDTVPIHNSFKMDRYKVIKCLLACWVYISNIYWKSWMWSWFLPVKISEWASVMAWERAASLMVKGTYRFWTMYTAIHMTCFSGHISSKNRIELCFHTLNELSNAYGVCLKENVM